MFAKQFRKHGQTHISRYLRSFKSGDIVDIVADSAEQKGMPHKYYQGRTGVVYGVFPRAVGVLIYKTVGNRKIEKRVNLRVEHVRHSKCRDDFVNRVKQNAERKRIAKEKGEHVNLKRSPAMPREAHTLQVSKHKPVTLAPQAYGMFRPPKVAILLTLQTPTSKLLLPWGIVLHAHPHDHVAGRVSGRAARRRGCGAHGVKKATDAQSIACSYGKISTPRGVPTASTLLP